MSLRNQNFAFSTLGGSVAIGAAQLSVASGHAPRFPSSGAFRAVIWGAAYASPLDDPNREIVTLTYAGGDVFKCSKAAEGTTDRAWAIGDNIAHVITAGRIDEAQAPVGSYLMLSGSTIPPGYLPCEGGLISMSLYRDLIDYWYSCAMPTQSCAPYGLGTGTAVTCNSATNQITWTAHNLADGDTVCFTAATMPSGVQPKRPYYVLYVDANTIQIALTPGGSAVSLGSAGTSVLGYTQVKLPAVQGRVPRVVANGSSNDPDRASRTDRGDGQTGDYVGTKQSYSNYSHTHTSSASSTATPTGSGNLNFNQIQIEQIYGGASVVSSVCGGPYSCGSSNVSLSLSTPVSTSVTINPSGGNEARMINFNVALAIKY